MKLRKSEEDEMARLIGTEIIEKLEVSIIFLWRVFNISLKELREQFNSMSEILCEIQDSNE